MRIIVVIAAISLLFFTSCFHASKIRQSKTGSESEPVSLVNSSSDNPINEPIASQNIRPAAERTGRYFHKLRHGKGVGVVANHTSLIKNTHLVDSLLNSGVNVIKIFTPEHGFRGTADAGEIVGNQIDFKTGLPIISLYGNHRKPLPDDLNDIDIVVFDMQDVGTRFYTYISTLSLVMEACAENNIPVLVLDRPNPNGFYVDGPVLDTLYKSFVGMHPVPVVHGMTIAEYGRMVNEEGWLKKGIRCDLDWVGCAGYNHSLIYSLPVRPSPNLPDMNSILLYPSLCFFEGTKVSVGRGTETPFSLVGYPGMAGGDTTFTPVSRPGALNPQYKNEVCSGISYADSVERIKEEPSIRLKWLIDIYNSDSSDNAFFTPYFTLLAGNKILQAQIEAGLSEQEIRKSWSKELAEFMIVRKKYLIYKDFE